MKYSIVKKTNNIFALKIENKRTSAEVKIRKTHDGYLDVNFNDKNSLPFDLYHSENQLEDIAKSLIAA